MRDSDQVNWAARRLSGGPKPIDPGQPKLSRKGIGVNTPTVADACTLLLENHGEKRYAHQVVADTTL